MSECIITRENGKLVSIIEMINGKPVEMDLEVLWDYFITEQQFRADLEAAPNYFAKLRVMARVYDYMTQHDKTSVSWHIKGVVDLRKLFTPIEDSVWDDMIYFGLRMYPQYPALKYVLDFADPFYKIAIECDGKEWHQDKAKDRKRHLELEKAGWTVYHIPGADTLRWVGEFYDLTAGPADQYDEEFYHRRHKILQRTSGGLIVCILAYHYNCRNISMLGVTPDDPGFYLQLNRETFFQI